MLTIRGKAESSFNQEIVGLNPRRRNFTRPCVSIGPIAVTSMYDFDLFMS